MVKPRESPHHGHHQRGKSTLMVLLALIPHSRGIYLFLLLLFEVAETVDGGEGIVVVGHLDTHGIVLIAYCGARVDVVVQDVFAFCHKTPLAVGCAIAERGIETEQWVNIIHALNGPLPFPSLASDRHAAVAQRHRSPRPCSLASRRASLLPGDTSAHNADGISLQILSYTIKNGSASQKTKRNNNFFHFFFIFLDSCYSCFASSAKNLGEGSTDHFSRQMKMKQKSIQTI